MFFHKKSLTQKAMATISNHPVATVGGVTAVGVGGYLVYQNRKLDQRIEALEQKLAKANQAPAEQQASA